jgi:hypothetical protein
MEKATAFEAMTKRQASPDQKGGAFCCFMRVENKATLWLENANRTKT